MEHKKETHYDAIVIGSGLSGLTAAGLLSTVNKKKVLVLEKHYEPGGLTHEFKRGAYSWDVGLHYVGNMLKRPLDMVAWFLFRFLTGGKLKWNKMPNPFDKLYYPGMTINVRESTRAYKKELYKNFPEHKKEIKKYLSDVYKARIWYIFTFFSCFLYSPLKQICKLFTLFFHKTALMTTEDYLKKNISDKRLRAVLTARWGNYGIPPQISAFAIHAVIEHHYYTGAVFPEGGAEKIASYIEETIESAGGNILINRDVTEIIIENNKAVGVKAINLADENKEVTNFYAPVIISSTGAKSTYLNLLPRSLNLPFQKKLEDYFSGYSGFDLFLGLKDSPETLGIKGENCWIVDGYELDLFNSKHHDITSGDACYCFLSFPSLKSEKPGGYTADIVTMIPYETFKKWENTYWKERPADYYELKEKISESLIKLIDKYIPGFSDLVVYEEAATPLTYKHFTGRPGGTFYGLPSIPARYKLKDLSIKTPVKNLYLTGTDLLCNGITPALFTGMATVSFLNGPLGIIKVMQKVFSFKPKRKKVLDYDQLTQKHQQSADKAKAVLVAKHESADNLVELTYRFNRELQLIPGQHVKLLVEDGEWRAYSIARANKRMLTLMIDTRPGGPGSTYAKNIQVQQESIFRLPLTDLIYHKTERNLMFIATGTGLVPFIHILDELKQMQIKHKIVIIFGCMHDDDNFIDDYITPYENYFSVDKHICVEDPDYDSPYYKGRVTDFIDKENYVINDYDYYICGHPHMTRAVTQLLRNKGADHIYW